MMDRKRVFCNCGAAYWSKMQLTEHIGLHNIRWPRKDPSDQHWEVSKAHHNEYLQERREQVEMARKSYGGY